MAGLGKTHSPARTQGCSTFARTTMAPLSPKSATGGSNRGGLFPDLRYNGSGPILVPQHAELVGDPTAARFGARSTLEAAVGLLFFAFFLYAWRWCKHALAFEVPTALPISTAEAAQAKRKQAREAGRKRKDSGLREVEMVTAADSLGPMPTLRGIADDTPCVLNQHQTRRLRSALPTSLSLCDWNLLYAASRDGYSLETFYERAVGKGPTLLIVADDRGHLLGGFSSASWERPTGNGRFTGTGESFVFTVSPKFATYAWTGKNSEFVLSRADMIAFGGGGNFALTLDARLELGSSDASETYGNPCLASGTRFKATNCELWSFKTAW